MAPAVLVRVTPADLSLVIPTISWGGPFRTCVQAMLADGRLAAAQQLLVVFDGEPGPAPAWLRHPGLELLATGQRQGPAAARNLAAQRARGEILVFVDADVELHAGTLDAIQRHFATDPGLSALFGSYDDRPAAPGLVSQFRNLLHHHTHHCHAGPAASFWAGCGAVRRQRFLELGGFDSRYRLPSIEDIEFGMRLAAAGDRILLDPQLLCTHHKRWTLGSMLQTDIRQRAVPWTRLLLRQRQLPNQLNLDPTARFSALAALLVLPALLVSPWQPLALLPAAAALLVLLVLNRRFYGLCRRRHGLGFAAGAVALHGLFLVTASASFAAVVLQERLRPGRLAVEPMPSPAAAGHRLS